MILASKRTLLASVLVISFACSDDEDTTTGNDPGTANNNGVTSGTNDGENSGTNDGENSGTASNGVTGSDTDAGTAGDPDAGGLDAGGSNATGGGNDAGAEDLEDGEIAAVTIAANLGGIKQAELALLRAKATPVREFAQSMATENGAAQARQTKLLAQLGIIARENAASMKVTQQSGMIIGGLEVTNAEAFDLAYVDSQVTFNETVLKLLDDQLIPGAEQMTLSEELQTMRTAVQAHLRQAQELKQELGQDSPDAG